MNKVTYIKALFVLVVLCIVSLPVMATPLHDAARSGDVATIRTLLEAGASVNARDEVVGNTPLHIAVGMSPVEVIHALLKAGASVNARNKAERTPLHIAAWDGQVEVIHALLEAGADVNARGKDDEWTPLHAAAEKGHVKAIHALLEAGASVNARGKAESTPLHIAVGMDQFEAIHALLKKAGVDVAGADVNATASGCSPLNVVRFVMETTEQSVVPFQEAVKVLQAAGGRELEGCQ